MDRLAAALDARRRKVSGIATTVGELAEAEPLAVVPDAPFSAMLEVVRIVSPQALVEFDFSAQPGVDEKFVKGLETLRFLDDASNVLFVGPTGVGNTMLAVGPARPGPRDRRGRAPCLLHHRRRTGRQVPQSRPGRPMVHLHAVLRRSQAPGDRPTGLPPAAGRRGLAALSGDQPAI